MKERIETQDFKQLAREMKAYFGVGSLGEVAELLGYSRNSASSWYLCGRVPDRAVLAFYKAQEKGEKPALKQEAHAEFKQLGREMKAFFGVGSLKAVAKAMGLSVAKANIWHRSKKFPDSVIAKFEQLRSQRQSSQQKQAPPKGLFSEMEATTKSRSQSCCMKQDARTGLRVGRRWGWLWTLQRARLGRILAGRQMGCPL
ncbi:hypothetical protein [Helicobacter felis]|uniref:hypothetical protein n=1 Tax=Helicobacter felis TaxID=214 RepID=UPI000EF651BB|nr:hypothetical protein [Helicobacter felis]